jgi:hypothetical protein
MVSRVRHHQLTVAGKPTSSSNADCTITSSKSHHMRAFGWPRQLLSFCTATLPRATDDCLGGPEPYHLGIVLVRTKPSTIHILSKHWRCKMTTAGGAEATPLRGMLTDTAGPEKPRGMHFPSIYATLLIFMCGLLLGRIQGT